MKRSIKLSILADELSMAVPMGDTRKYLTILAMYHDGAEEDPEKPAQIPFYGHAFANALQAIEMGWENRVAYHSDRIKAAIKKSGKNGFLCEVRRVERPKQTMPQPTDRKKVDSGRTPNAWKEEYQDWFWK